MRRVTWLLIALVAVGCSSTEPVESPDWTPVAESRSASAIGTAPVLQIYEVRDLVPRAEGDAGVERLASEIRTNVSPDSWGDDTAAVRAQSGVLVVKHTPAVHREIADYLQTLRGGAMAPR